jgi:polar amino acid transport system substrate-binding protein
MEAFLDLISQGKINVRRLVSHVFDIEKADAAYDIVLGKVKEPHSGILLKYTPVDTPPASRIRLKEVAPAGTGGINVGVIGAGSFAQNYLIPNIKAWGAALTTVVNARGITSKNVAEKFAFANASSDVQDIFGDQQINTVFIATPHNTHAEYVLRSLQAGKSVFVEKPLALHPEELEAIEQHMQQHGGRLMIGFNRRFSPVAQALKAAFGRPAQPLVINYRVNAGFIPKEHWIQDPATGGGRIVGEACHFIDLMQYFTGALPVKVYAACIDGDNDKLSNEDNVCIIIHFRDGSVGTLTYVASGDKSLPKERVEIFGDGKVGVIDDFKKGELRQQNKVKNLNLQGKGHKEEVQAFLHAVAEGLAMPVDFESIRYTTVATFKILDSLRTGLPQTV